MFFLIFCALCNCAFVLRDTMREYDGNTKTTSLFLPRERMATSLYKGSRYNSLASIPGSLALETGRKFEGQWIGLSTGRLSPWGVSRGPKYLQYIKPDSVQSCLLHSLGGSDPFLGFLILFAALVLPLHLVATRSVPTAAAQRPIKTVAQSLLFWRAVNHSGLIKTIWPPRCCCFRCHPCFLRQIWSAIIPRWLLLQITQTEHFFSTYVISKTESWL